MDYAGYRRTREIVVVGARERVADEREGVVVVGRGVTVVARRDDGERSDDGATGATSAPSSDGGEVQSSRVSEAGTAATQRSPKRHV